MNDVLLTVPVLDNLEAQGEQLRTILLTTVLGLMYVGIVIVTLTVTKSFLKGAAAAVGGAVVVGIVLAQVVLSEQTAEQIEQGNKGAAVVRPVEGIGGGA